MAVKVCKALSAAISLCCGEPGTCQCRRVRLRLRRAACEAHTLSPIELQSLISPSSGEILAECPPFICSPRQSSSPNDPHFSIFYTPEMGTAPIPLISLRFSLLFIPSFVCFHSLEFRRQIRVELLIASNIWRFADIFFSNPAGTGRSTR